MKAKQQGRMFWLARDDDSARRYLICKTKPILNLFRMGLWDADISVHASLEVSARDWHALGGMRLRPGTAVRIRLNVTCVLAKRRKT